LAEDFIGFGVARDNDGVCGEHKCLAWALAAGPHIVVLHPGNLSELVSDCGLVTQSFEPRFIGITGGEDQNPLARNQQRE